MPAELKVYTFRRQGTSPKDKEGKERLGWKWRAFTLPAFSMDKLLFSRQNLKEALLLGGMGFFMAKAPLLGSLYPFAPAFLAAAAAQRRAFTLPLAAVVLMGAITSAREGWSHLLILLVLAGILLLKPIEGKSRWLQIPLLVFLITIGIQGFTLGLGQADLDGVIALIVESLLSGLMTLAFLVAGKVWARQQGFKDLTREEGACLALVAAGVLLGLTPEDPGAVTLQGVVSRLAVLVAALTWGGGIGAATGVVVGLLPSLAQLQPPGAIGVYALTGLLAGVLRGLGKGGALAGYLLGTALLSLYLVDLEAVKGALVEGGLAAALILMIPQRWLEAMARAWGSMRLGREPEVVGGEGLQEVAADRVRELGRLFHQLSRTFEEMTATKEEESYNLGGLFNNIAAKVCLDCSLYRTCWEKNFYRTYQGILDLFAQVEAGGKGALTKPGALIKGCPRKKELVATVSGLYDTYQVDQFWRKRLMESQEMVAAQLKGVAQIMANLAGELRLNMERREDLEAKLLEGAARQGLYFTQLEVLESPDYPLEIHAVQPKCLGELACMGRVAPVISQLLGQRMEVHHPQCAHPTQPGFCRYSLVPAENYSLKVGVAQGIKEGMAVSGDHWASMTLPDGTHALILSDGMGAGTRAALESSATVALIRQLLQSGFDKELAVQTVNSILLLRSPEEMFSTVDLALIHLYSADGELIKIGAAPSYLKRRSQVTPLRASSLPMGIFQSVEAEHLRVPLTTGDFLIMVTDGVADATKAINGGEDWLQSFLERIRVTEPQEMADMILSEAMALAGGAYDDMTVMVAKVERKLV